MVTINQILELNKLFKQFVDIGDLYTESVGKGDKNLDQEHLQAIQKARTLATKSIPEQLSKMFNQTTYACDGSIGQGRIANTPWIAVRNKDIFGRKDGFVKASIVFFISSKMDKVFVTIDLRASDFEGTGDTAKSRSIIRTFADEIAERIGSSYPNFLPVDKLNIAKESYRSGAVYTAEWSFDNMQENIDLLTALEASYQTYNEIQTSDNPVMPDNSVVAPRKVVTTPQNPETEAESETKPFSPIQKIFFGTPGGGKSHKVKVLIEEEHKAKDRQFRTTFHPDTDYASFVGSYKPVMKGNDITYAYVPQVFTQAYIAAWNDQENEYFLDIEEINRGNCAQIFGDLFQLLDRNKEGISEYPIKADADLCDFLENGTDKEGNQVLTNKDGIKNGNLMLPANLSIVATMNTSDQSLFPMDSAFKRRWDWEFVPSTFNEKDNFNIVLGKRTYKWHTFLNEANARIKQATDSEDKQMGSYFVKTDMDEEKFKSKVMYYLWSEICKDEYKTQNNFFRYIDNENNEQEFTFNELYSEGSTKMLQKFMKFLNVKAINEPTETPEDVE